jgi:TolB protein
VWVVDIETGDKQLITTFEPVDIFVNQFLPFFDQYAKSHRIWSPDSNALVLPMLGFRNTGEPTAYVHVVSTDWRVPKRVIAEGLMAFWSQS